MSTCQNPIDMLSDLLEEVADDDVSYLQGNIEDMSENSDSDRLSDIETRDKPRQFLRPRRGAVCAEPIETGYYKEPFWNKQEVWDVQLFKLASQLSVFQGFSISELNAIVRVMSTHFYYEGEWIFQQGEEGNAMFIVLQGSVDSYHNDGLSKKAKHIASLGVNSIIDEICLVWNSPRSVSMCARENSILVRLTRNHFSNCVVRMSVYRYWGFVDLLKGASLLEMMKEEQIGKLVDVLKLKKYKAGELIIRQGDEGNKFYIVNSGECRVWVMNGGEEQEYTRYHRGNLFGELALLKNAPRAANVTAVSLCELLCLSRGQFERLLGPMAQLHQQQYLTDPRKLIADFYGQSDVRGPLGSLKLQDADPDASRGKTKWFVVYRPTSTDAIAKMLSGNAVGKGLNVKGKSAKQGVLSGYVPFIQISDNKHKGMIEQSPPNARLVIYYKTAPAREEAHKALQLVMDSAPDLKIKRREIDITEDYQPQVFGLELPEPLVREAYIMRPDLSPVMGWEVGRRSEPAFMDMNLHAVRDASEPLVVLYQYDESDSMNPRGLLIAYAEKFCKPVVSDFDTFLVGSYGMVYEPLPQEQIELIQWGLRHTEDILNSLDHNPWTSRWLEVLKKENERGFHPKFPKYGYGDPTSYRICGDIVKTTEGSGAIRHGAECFNFYFPQELDDEFLVVWDGFPEKPWQYLSEAKLRDWLLARIGDEYTFPLNPIWPIRDKGWMDVLQALLGSQNAQIMKAWLPDDSGLLTRIMDLNRLHPNGFVQNAGEQKPEARVFEKSKSKPIYTSGDFNKDGAEDRTVSGMASLKSGNSRRNADAPTKTKTKNASGVCCVQ